ncbi:MAG: transposase [Novosphingobium sp.]|nr:transposase [Novosphingobium sp.]
MQNLNHVAVDLSKAMLDVALPSPWRTPNTPAGLAAFKTKLGGIERPHVVCEATGRYGRLLARTMDAASIPFSSVNPRQVRDFARATGQLAKTDAIDAGMILMEQSDERAVQRARCMTLETMAPLSDNPIVMLSAVPGT